MAGPTRGFLGRRRSDHGDRLPPGQYDVGRDFPVLTAEVTPRLDPDRWTMTVDGLVADSRVWTWAEMHALPQSEYRGDIHCVTTWSKFDTSFAGVSVDVLLDAVQPLPAPRMSSPRRRPATRRTCLWSTSRDGKAWVVWTYDDKPLPRDHGGPVRLLVPHLYFWKSAKWVTKLTLLDHDQQGFWERNGYHDLGDPWREQRYQGD